MRRILIIFIALAVILPISAKAADKEVKGIVTDVTGEPLAGVAVMIEGTTTGTVTDTDGQFKLTIPDSGETVLVFSSIGFISNTLTVGDSSYIKAVLNESTEFIEETVVIGYGSMKKSDLTGSVSSITIGDLDALQSNSFDKLLQGKLAGVSVTTGSAAPGGTMSILIRGVSSINSSSEPLYVVDGIIINGSGDTGTVFSGSDVQKSQDSQNALSMLNPSDVANIEVLKDASATAIYGAQGANGVVIITTKQGMTDRPTVNLTHSTDISWNPKHFDMLNMEEYLRYKFESTGEEIDSSNLQPIDWQDYAQRLAVSNNTRLSVSGRTSKDNYYVSVGYLDNKGVLKKTGVRQVDGRVNYNVNIGKHLKLGTNTALSYRLNNMTQGTDMGAGGGGMFTSMVRQMINTRPYKVTNLDDVDANEALIGVDRWFNDYEDKSNEFRLLSSVYAEITILKRLKWRSSVGIDYRNKDRVRYEGPEVVNVNQSYTSRLGIAQMTSFKYNTDHQITYSPKIGKYHNLSAMLGLSLSSTSVINKQFQGTDMSVTDYREYGFNYAQTTTVPAYSHQINTLLSFFTRLIYNYRDRYIVTATYRADGSSKFAPGNKFGFFPSFAAAWRVSQESFMKNVDFVSNLKFRAGWGQVGNQTLSPYQTLLSYGTITVPIYDPVYGGSFIIGGQQNNIVNKNLRWETSDQVNIGIDLGILDNRINVTVDLYNKKTKDLLLKVNVPPSMSIKNGTNSIWENKGLIQNKGLEISAELYPVRTNSVVWSISGNISFNRNKILSLNIPDARIGVYNAKCFLGNNISGATYLLEPATIFMEGYPMGMFFGYKSDGIIRTEEENIYTFKNNPMKLGGYKYQNIDDSDNDINDNDRMIIGDPNPKFTGGFSTSITWKGLTVEAVFTGSYGNQIVNGNTMINGNTGANALSNQINILKCAYYDAFNAETNPDGKYAAIGTTSLAEMAVLSSRIIEDGSYLRLSNVSVSYSFNLAKAKWIKGLTLTLSGRNLCLWTRYSGYDPDVNSFMGDGMRRGVDYGSYPANRAGVFSINASF